MTEKLSISDAHQHIGLPDGDEVLLLDRLGKGNEFTRLEKARNIYRVDSEGNIKWEIKTNFDEEGVPFTSIRMKNGLSAYRWDGVRYGVDLETGEASPLLLEK